VNSNVIRMIKLIGDFERDGCVAVHDVFAPEHLADAESVLRLD